MAKFDLREWVVKGLHEAIGNEPPFKTRRYAEKYYEKDVLTDEDMAELGAALDALNIEPTTEETEETM